MSEIVPSEQPSPPESTVEQTEFPRDPAKRIDVILSAFNFGPKAVTELLLPGPDSYITPSDLNAQFRAIFAGSEVENILKIPVVGYCDASLVKLGLVAREYRIPHFGQDRLVGYGKTSAGRHYGVPAACLIIHTESDIDQSMVTLLGSSNTKAPSQLRSPLVRALVLKFLRGQSQPVTGMQIATDLGIRNGLVLNGVKTLLHAGVVTKRVIESKNESEVTAYTLGDLNPEEVKRTGGGKPLTDMAVKACMQLSEQGVPITVDNVLDNLPSEYTSTVDVRSARDHLAAVLPNLARQRFLNITNDFQRVGIHAEIAINSKGIKVVDELLTPLDLLVRDDPRFGQLYGSIVKDVQDHLPEYARRSGDLYFSHSKSAKRQQTKESIGRLKELLSDKARIRGFSVRELAIQLGIHENTVRDYLKSLGKSLIPEVYRGTTRFRLPPT